MAKTKASEVNGGQAIKDIGNGYIEFVARCADEGRDIFRGTGMEIGNNGELLLFTTGQPDHPTGVTVAETIIDDDRYFLAKKKGAKILHNQKLAGAYVIGDAVYESSKGVWTHTDESTVESLLHEAGFVVGPEDRITDNVVKDIDDALTATEPVDILI